MNFCYDCGAKVVFFRANGQFLHAFYVGNVFFSYVIDTIYGFIINPKNVPYNTIQ